MRPQTVVLKNGLKCTYIYNKNLLSTIIHLRGLCGSNYEHTDEMGASHILEHLTLNYGQDNVLKAGGNVIGITSRDDVLYVVKILNKDIKVGIDFLYKRLVNTKFTTKQFQASKRNAVNEVLRHINSAEKMIVRYSNKIMFENQRFSHLNTGNVQDINKLTLKKVLAFKKRLYVGTRFVLVGCGGLKPKDFFKEIELKFSEIQISKNLNPLEVKYVESYVSQSINMPTAQTHVKVDYKAYKISDPKYHPTQILTYMIQKYLDDNLRSMSYKKSCSLLSSINYGIFSLYVSTDNASEVAKLIKNIYLQKLKILTKSNFEISKNKTISDLIFYLEKGSGMADFYSSRLLDSQCRPNHNTEINKYNNVALLEVKNIFNEIFTQKPKVTVISKNLKKRNVDLLFNVA